MLLQIITNIQHAFGHLALASNERTRTTLSKGKFSTFTKPIEPNLRPVLYLNTCNKAHIHWTPRR